MADTEPLRYLDAGSFDRALPVERAIEAMETIFRADARGEVEAASRQVLHDDLGSGRRSLMLTMPAAWRGRAFATKVVGFVADNPAHGRPAVQGVAVLLDSRTGTPRLIADAASLTVRRTAAMVGLAADRLADPGARCLGLIGTGALAEDMIRAVAAVRPIDRVRLYNRTRSRAEALAERSPLATDVADAPESVAGEADVLVIATSSTEPVVRDGAIRAGTHVAAVGCFDPAGRELEGTTVGRADLWVDGYEGALEEAGDLLLASREGRIGPLPEALRGDLGALAAGERRKRRRELTIFKSVGTAVADLGALVAAEERARRADLGLRLS